MSWQRPPFNPQRARMWPGGFTRVFGVVSDGVTTSYGLRAAAASYLVLFDGVPVPSTDYSVDAAAGSVAFAAAPPAGAWIEILGFGRGQPPPPAPVADWLAAGYNDLAALAGLAPAFEPRYAYDQAAGLVHTTNGAAVDHNGDVILIPQDEYDLVRVNTADRSLERIRVPGLDLYDYAKFAGGLAGPNGRIYGCPDKAAAVMEFDPVTGVGRMIRIEPTYGDHVWTNDMIATGAAVGGAVYGIPFDADYFMTIDGHGARVGYDDYGLDLAPPGKWYGGVHYNGAFFAVPYNHPAVLRIRPDPVNQGRALLDLIDLTTAHPEYACKYRGGFRRGNKAYFVPFEADHVLEFNLDNFTMVEKDWGLDLSGRFKYWGGAAAGDLAVFCPFDAKRFLVANLAADTAELVDYGLPADIFGFDHAYAGVYADPHGRVHLIAYQAGCGLAVDPALGVAFVRRTTGKDGMYLGGGGAVKYADGCEDGEGRIYINPYNTDGVHWTIDARAYAVDRLATGLAPVADVAYAGVVSDPLVAGGMPHGIDVVGVRDFGDHYWWLFESGDARQLRLSGYLNTETIDTGQGTTVTRPLNPPLVRDPGHYPVFSWGRKKAFFGLYSHPAGFAVAAPSSQPYFAVRADVPSASGAAAPVERLGPSRDQFYNGAVLAADGRIYGIPYNGSHILRFDVQTAWAELHDYGLDLLGRRKWYGGVRAGNRIYGIPFDADGVLVIDTSFDPAADGGAGAWVTTAWINDYGLDLSDRRKFMAGGRQGTNVVFVPCDSDRFMVIDTANETAVLTDYGIPAAIMSQTLKWGAAAVDAQGTLVCGPLGTVGTAAADLRAPAWITAGGQAGWSTARFNGCGAGTLTVAGRTIFRIKESFGGNATIAGAPRVAPENLAAGETAAAFPSFRTITGHGWHTDCAWAIDYKIYRMSDTRDLCLTVDAEDWSTNNDFDYYDDVPGIRPWVGYPPSAWARYDPDEEALYPVKELRAYRKEAGWNDPIFTGNNTLYGIPCSAGIVTRNTVGQYNHFRDYLRDTNNFERCYWGAVEVGGDYYAVPHALPLLNILDAAAGTVTRRRFDPPPGWDHTVLWKDGTEYNGLVVFYPYRQKWFGYYDPAHDSWEFPELPVALFPDLAAKDNWRAWVRRGDYVWGIPYNSTVFVKWDLAGKTAVAVAAPAEEMDWTGKPWSDAVTFNKSESGAERDAAFLLPYNDERLGVLYPWQRAAGPCPDFEHFSARFPGQRKWSCWAVPHSTVEPPVMYGVPCDAAGLLVCDVRGAEPYIDDFGLDLDWDVQGKWMSVVDLRLLGAGCVAGEERPVSLAIPYNADVMLAIDHWMGKVYKVEYSGYSLAGERKWWGGAGRLADKTGIAYFAPFDAPGVLAVTLTSVVEGGQVVMRATGELLNFGLDMLGAGKWRGAVLLGDKIVMIPYNRDKFLVIAPPTNANDGVVSAAAATGSEERLGIPAELLAPLAKWAPTGTTTLRGADLTGAPREHEFPAETHESALRLAFHANAPSAWLVPHEQAVGDRGWIPVRHRHPYAPKYDYSVAIPHTADSFLVMAAACVDVYCAGWRLWRPGKFAAAAVDHAGGIVCLPAGGYQVMVYDPDAGAMAWIRQANDGDGAPGGFSEFAYRAPSGRVWGAVRAAWRGRLADGDHAALTSMQQEALRWRTLRPYRALGDAFVLDRVTEYVDTESYWPRWYSYGNASTARWRDVCVEEAGANAAACDQAPAAAIATETRRHGCMFASEAGMGLMPGNTGSMILYRRSAGRAGFDRIQLSLIFDSGGAAEKAVRNPSTFAVARSPGADDRAWLIPTATYKAPEHSTGWSDPLYLHEIEVASGDMTHHRLDCPWYARSSGATVNLAVIAAGRYAWLFPKELVVNVDGTPMAAGAMRIDLVDFAQAMFPCSVLGAAGGRWHPRLFETAEAPVALPVDPAGALLVFTSDGSAFSFRVPDPPVPIEAFTQLGYRYDPALLAFDGAWVFSVVVTYAADVADRAAGVQRLTATVRMFNLDSGAQGGFARTLVVAADAPYGLAGAVVHRDGRLYCALAPKVGSVRDSRIYVNLMYLEIDLSTQAVEVKSAYGAPTMSTIGGFLAEDGTIWYEMAANSRLIRFLRLDPDAVAADEPVRQGRHVGTQSSLQFNPCQAAAGARRFLAPALIRSRSSVLYILDTGEPSLRSYGYVMACKDTHKWNGWVYDGVRYAYGMPYNNDTILRLDFDNPVAVVADQRTVDDYAYVEANRRGGELDFVYHKSDPAQGHARGGTLSRYGVVWSNPYAPLDGGTLEIKPNGRSRVRVPGPDYAYPRKWADLVAGPGGVLYGAPFDSPEVFYLDPDGELAGSSYANMYEGLDGWEKYAVAAAGPEKVYMLPYSATDILVVDTAAHRLMKLEPAGIDLSGKRKWRGGYRVGDEVYCAPYDADAVLRFNPVTEEAALLPVPGDPGEAKWRCFVPAADGKLYAPPYGATDMLALDPATGEMERFGLGMDFAGPHKWTVAALARDGQTIMAAGGASAAFLELEFDDDAETVTGRLVEGFSDPDPNTSRYGYIAQQAATVDGEAVEAWFAAPATTRLPARIYGGDVVAGTAAAGDPAPDLADRWLGGYLHRQAGVDRGLVLVPYNHSTAARLTAANGLELIAAGAWIDGSAKWSDVTVRTSGGVATACYVPWDSDRWLTLNLEHLLVDETDFGTPMPEGPAKWSCGWRVGARYYAIPYNAEVGAVVDLAAGSVEYHTFGLDPEKGYFIGDGKWSGYAVTGSGDYVRAFCAPYNAEHILLLSSAGAGTIISPQMAFLSNDTFCGAAPFNGGYVLANRLYDFPCLVAAGWQIKPGLFGSTLSEVSASWRFGGAHKVNDDQTLLLPGGRNINANHAVAIVFERDGGGGITWTKATFNFYSSREDGAKTVAAVNRGGMAYLLPFDSARVIRYDPDDKAFTEIASLSLPAGRQYTGGWVDRDGNVLAVPYDAQSVCRIAPNDAVSLVSLGSVDLSGSAKWWGCIEAADGRRFFIPYSAAKVVVVAADGVDAEETDYDLDLSGEAKWRGAFVLGDRVVMVPYYADKFLVIDTATDTAELASLTDDRLNAYYGLFTGGRCGCFTAEPDVTGDDGIEAVLLTVFPGTPADDGVAAVPARLRAWFAWNDDPGRYELRLARQTAARFPVDWSDREKFGAAYASPHDPAVVVFAPARANYFMEYNRASGTVTTARYGADLSSDADKYRGAAVAADKYVYLVGKEISSARITPSGVHAQLGYTNDVGVVADGNDAYFLSATGLRRRYVSGNYRSNTTLGGAAGFTQTADSYRNLRLVDGTIYSALYDSNYLFINPLASAVAYHAPSADLSGAAKWRGCIAREDGSGGYALPYDDVRVFHHDGSAAWLYDVENVPEGSRRWFGGCWFGGVIYGCPYDAQAIGRFDPVSKTFDLAACAADLSGTAKYSYAFAEGDEIYFMPAMADHVLVYNPATGAHRAIPFPYGSAGDDEPWLAWVRREDKVYGIPCRATDVAVFDIKSEEFLLQRIGLDLAGRERWACGMAAADGRLIFPPYLAERALRFDPLSRRGMLTWAGSRAAMAALRPVTAIVRWRDNEELIPDRFDPDTDLGEEGEEGGEPLPEPEPEPEPELDYEWFAVSAVTGVARYDPDTGAIDSHIADWSANPDLPTDQFHGFAYSEISGKVYGVPYNASGTLAISNRDGVLRATVGRMGVDMAVNSELKTESGGGRLKMWRLYADNYACGGRDFDLAQVLGGGSARRIVRVDPFTGILYAAGLDRIMEWERPPDVLVIQGGGTIITEQTLWENKYGLFSAMALGPDGLLYFVPDGSLWGLAAGAGGVLDRVYAPLRGEMVKENDNWSLRWFPYAWSACAVDGRGRIVVGPGRAVTAGAIGKSGAGFSGQSWFDAGVENVDSLGHPSRRAVYPVFFIDTGVYASAACMRVISRLLNFG